VTQLRNEKELLRASGNISRPTIVANILAANKSKKMTGLVRTTFRFAALDRQLNPSGIVTRLFDTLEFNPGTPSSDAAAG
jgi:hypothetical protein